MKKIKIKICKYNDLAPPLTEHFIYKILSKYYEVELSETPDYIFFHEATREYLNYDCVRIFNTGENVSPNFNLCDYAVGCDYMAFGDRFYRLPVYAIAVFYHKDEMAEGIDTDFVRAESFSREDLAKKTEFCSFVYSNYLSDDNRKNFFDKLCAYKKVNAGGRYLNNIGGPVENKLQFEAKHKFSIAFENSSRSGYTTEKLPAALAAKTIPIYWGNPDIHKEFNEKRFINCHRYENFDQVVERVKEIDNNDGLYLSIINEPITVPGYDFKAVREGFEVFLRNIIDQPLATAKRRTINRARQIEMEKNEGALAKYIFLKDRSKKFLAKLYRPFKKIKFLENLKYKFFRATKLK